MTLRPRRNVVLWSHTATSPGRHHNVPVTRGRRIRRWIRRGTLLIVIGLMAVGRAALARFRRMETVHRPKQRNVRAEDSGGLSTWTDACARVTTATKNRNSGPSIRSVSVPAGRARRAGTEHVHSSCVRLRTSRQNGARGPGMRFHCCALSSRAKRRLKLRRDFREPKGRFGKK